MPALFRREPAKQPVEEPTDVVDDASAASGRSAAEPAVKRPESTGTAQDEADEQLRPRGYTPSKKELGKATPKRPSPHLRRPGATAAPASRKNMTKEERRELKEARRARRREITEGMRQGDPRYLASRDQGPERALARDVVDSRRTFGTWFFGGALVVLIGSSTAIPQVVVLANLLFVFLALALAVDSVLLCRKAKRLIQERHPDSTQRMRSIYLYIVMRSITFRRMRVPLPRKNLGDPI